VNTFIAFGVMLLVGLVGGQLAHLLRYIPRITGYILIGFLLGPRVSGFLTPEIIGQSAILKELAIGLILFELGLQIRLKYILANPTIILTAIFQGAAVFFLIFVGLVLLDFSWMISALSAAIGISISPAVTLLIANEYNAQGTVVEHSLILTALNNIIAFLVYACIVTIAQHSEADQHHVYGFLIDWLYPLYRMVGSLFVAWACSFLMILLGRFVGKKENMQFILLVGMLAIVLGLSELLYISPFLSMLAFGLVTVNLDHQNDLMEVELGYLSEIFIVILFVMVGADLYMDYFLKAGLFAFCFIILRTIGNTVPVLFIKNITFKQGMALGLTFLPMAGIAIALLDTTKFLTHGFHESLSFLILTAVALLEVIGPLTTVMSLRWCGELRKSHAVAY